jgi:hypothetical protein
MELMAHKGKTPRNYNPPNRPLFFSMGETKNPEFWDNLKKGVQEREEKEKKDEENNNRS